MARAETSLRNLVGQEFGPYTLVRRLGVGGMAETFEAVRHGPIDFEQRVCLKLVLPFYEQNEDFIELFHREAKLAAKLRHSNIVGVIDFGQIDGKSYIALQLVDGCDLRTLLDAQDRARLPPDQVALIGLDLAAALEHAHNPGSREPTDGSGSISQPIIHRDISPSNVLISRSGEVMLTDFGVAKAITGTARKQSAIKGKIPYMSPEQLRGEAIDGRSDLFALGVVMFEALSGQRPYEGPNDPATILLTLQGEHPSLRSLAMHAPPKLCDVIESLIEPDSEKRPQTAAELAEALDELTPPRRTRRTLGEVAAATPRQSWPIIGEPESSVEETKRGRSSASAPVPEPAVGDKAPSEAEAPTVRVEPSPEPKRSPVSKTGHRRWWIAAALLGTTASAGFLALALLPASQSGVTSPREEVVPTTSLPSTARPSAPVPSAFEAEPKTESQDEPAAAVKPESALAPAAPSEPKRAATGPTPAPMKTAERSKSATPATLAPATLTVIAIPWGDVWIDGKPVGSSPLKNLVIAPGRHEISAGRGSPTKSQIVRLKPGQRTTIRLDLTD